MPKREFRDRVIEITDFDDVSSGEHVIEFHDPAILRSGSHIAVVIPEDGGWQNAFVSINPHIPEISADFMAWAIQTARDIVHGA